MALVDRDLARLHRMIELLDDEKESPAIKIEALHELVFEGKGPERRGFILSPAREWARGTLERVVNSIEQVVIRYVRLYQDPRDLPVTHYKRQKRTAIHLDGQFGPVLREFVIRGGKETLQEPDGSPARDEFLDEPILYLKQEARSGKFPKSKKGGGLSLQAIQERFEMKLTAKGVSLGSQARWRLMGELGGDGGGGLRS